MMNTAVSLGIYTGDVFFMMNTAVSGYLHRGCVLYDEYCSVWVFTQGMCSL